MALHSTTQQQSLTKAQSRGTGADRETAAARPLVWGAAAVTGWAALAGGMALLWRYGFDFPVEEAWPLAVGLASMIAMLVTLLLVVGAVLKHEEESTP